MRIIGRFIVIVGVLYFLMIVGTNLGLNKITEDLTTIGSRTVSTEKTKIKAIHEWNTATQTIYKKCDTTRITIDKNVLELFGFEILKFGNKQRKNELRIMLSYKASAGFKDVSLYRTGNDTYEVVYSPAVLLSFENIVDTTYYESGSWRKKQVDLIVKQLKAEAIADINTDSLFMVAQMSMQNQCVEIIQNLSTTSNPIRVKFTEQTNSQTFTQPTTE